MEAPQVKVKVGLPLGREEIVVRPLAEDPKKESIEGWVAIVTFVVIWLVTLGGFFIYLRA